jgi:hypothetical protein
LTSAAGSRRLRRVEGVPLDGLVARILDRSPFRFEVAADAAAEQTAYALRGRTVVERGWVAARDLADGLERDDFDDHAVQVIGWDAEIPMCTGRIVLPPGLPTERACGLVVEPAGHVADVGRMCVIDSYRSREQVGFVGLMCALYAQVRLLGYDVACGMMTAPARMLVRSFGLTVQLLGPEREYWNESRAPVRFELMVAPEIIGSVDDATRQAGGR